MIRAVVCDDETATLDIIQYFIESESCPMEIVGMAKNGVEALRLIQETKPDLAFMDIRMPMMNGFEVIQQVEGVKIIIITAYDSFEHAQRALRMGVSDILAKPIQIDQLREAVHRTLGGNYTENLTVNQALAYIHRHYRENIRLSDLAEETYCSESYLSRLFRQYMDETILSYMHRQRVKAAAAMLREGQASIQEASDAVGYQSLNNFYKYFKQYTGETPASYVKKKNQTKCTKNPLGNS